MTIRNTLIAVATAASVALPAVSAQAGDDEEVFALGALAGAVGVVVVGGIAASIAQARQPNVVAPLGYDTVPVTADSHVAYCADRYRTYDAPTNTFQPNVGPRRQCVSPFNR